MSNGQARKVLQKHTIFQLYSHWNGFTIREISSLLGMRLTLLHCNWYSEKNNIRAYRNNGEERGHLTGSLTSGRKYVKTSTNATTAAYDVISIPVIENLLHIHQ